MAGGALDLRKIDPGVDYPLQQVGDLLNLSYASVLKLKKQGLLQNIKQVGRRYYVSGEEILKYVRREK